MLTSSSFGLLSTYLISRCKIGGEENKIGQCIFNSFLGLITGHGCVKSTQDDYYYLNFKLHSSKKVIYYDK